MYRNQRFLNGVRCSGKSNTPENKQFSGYNMRRFELWYRTESKLTSKCITIFRLFDETAMLSRFLVVSFSAGYLCSALTL